jgi:uncharacterized membrane protein YkgB
MVFLEHISLPSLGNIPQLSFMLHTPQEDTEFQAMIQKNGEGKQWKKVNLYIKTRSQSNRP